ncbi:4Fe-4S dicluster domain-containing protein [bacterium]|nr:4Fe-4S dicluster domain-containing protein [bacterium]
MIEDQFYLTFVREWDPSNHTLPAYRPVQPLKSLVFPPREALGMLFQKSEVPSVQERIILGVNNCDLHSLRIHDYVMQQTEPADPMYSVLRERTLIVSIDCTACRATCFCTVVGEQPYPKSGFDINLSPIKEGYIIESGSARGEALLEQCAQILAPVSDTQIQARDKKRHDLSAQISKQSAEKGLKPELDFQAAIQKTAESDLWKSFAHDCVECGACNFACCTCHCFLLVDGQGDANQPSRVKQWDSCLYQNFARVAGGANPRAHRAERLYNRFDKKFNFFPQVLGGYACDGCGRCIEACTGKIDIRDVLKKATDEL